MRPPAQVYSPPTPPLSTNSPQQRDEADRSRLRAAIQAVKPATPPSGRSPLEILRQKQAAKSAREEALAPKTQTPAAKTPPSPRPHERIDNTPPQAPRDANTSKKETPEVSSSNEISPELLRSVIGKDD